ncbi:MAG: hypothetical protein IT367_17950 [Candidatus Hydrogenedentes bacterium]|nr:hypothetical protein [Candidatus Hydrogenedentota bacterium]
MANLAEILRKIEELPPDKLEDVAHYVDTITSSSENNVTEVKSSERSFADGPYFGMWADRPEMEDSAKWVRELREKEWSRYRADESE